MAASSEENFDPGAAIYGNFINYYSFNPAQNRTRNIPNTLFNDLQISIKNTVTCLDVGCNSGELTTELYRHLKSNQHENNIQFLGLDLDPILIERCIDSNKFPKNITFKELNFMDGEHRDYYLADFLKRYNSTKFNLTFAFSVTMWIHINYGDDGLRDFLNQISKWTQFLLVEPQPWKCYRLAARRLKRSNVQESEEFQTKINSLKMRENIEQKIIVHLTENCQLKQINEFDKTKWNRRILLFESNK